MSTFGDRFPVEGVPLSMGLPPERRRLLRRPACAACPGAFADSEDRRRHGDDGGVERRRRLLEDHARRAAGAPTRPRCRLRHLLTQADDRRSAAARRRHPRHLRHADARQPRHPRRASSAGACTTSPPIRGRSPRIVARPELVPGAVEEFLRAYPIVSMARKLTQDVDFHGCPMKKDEMVLLSIQSATRDPRDLPGARRGDHRPLAEPAHRLRRQRAPLPRLPPRPGRAADRHRRSGTRSSPSTASTPTSHCWPTAARSRCSPCRWPG